MYQQQHFMDLQESSGFGDPNSWLSGEDDVRRAHHSYNAAAVGGNGNLDLRLFNDLVEMFPLVEHLIDQKERRSFTRRGSMIYTKTPSRESLFRRVPEQRGRNSTRPVSATKKKETGDKDEDKNSSGDQVTETALLLSRTLTAERGELDALREQAEDLRSKLSEKDELLKSFEMSENQVNEVNAKLEEMKQVAAEKESLIKSMQLQLSDAKIKLADKQAALEKTHWEAMTSRAKVEKLQQELYAVQGEVSSFVHLFEGLEKIDSTKYSLDDDVKPYQFEHLPFLDDLVESDMKKIEAAEEAYIVAIARAKEREDEESLVAAAKARVYLNSLVSPS